MITYFYWAIFIGVAIAIIFLIGIKLDNMKVALAGAAALLLTGWLAYQFYFQQIFVKRWGGVMTIRVPDGQYHITTTWKDDNLWVENYDPESNKCVFSEYSKGNLLQGRVTIKNCNPIMFLVGAGTKRPDGPDTAPQTQHNQAQPLGGGPN